MVQRPLFNIVSNILASVVRSQCNYWIANFGLYAFDKLLEQEKNF